MSKYSEEIYEKMLKRLQKKNRKYLSLEVFGEYGIHSLRALHKHVKKYGQYGGCLQFPDTKEWVILPFHNDFMNKWLKFNSVRVKAAYDKIYSFYQEQYPDREEFKRKRFQIEEDFLFKCWKMPAMDTRILEVPINGCWDRMEIFAAYLEAKGYEVKRLCCHDGNIMRGHTYIVYNTGKYWTTCLEYPLNFHYKDFASVCRVSFGLLKRVPIFAGPDYCELISFGKPEENMSTREYLELIRSGEVIFKRKKVKPKKKQG